MKTNFVTNISVCVCGVCVVCVERRRGECGVVCGYLREWCLCGVVSVLCVLACCCSLVV